MGLFAFVSKVVDIFPLFPQGHTLVVGTPVVTVAYSMWIADEERANFLLYVEVNHLTCGLISLIADTAFSTFALFVFRVL